MTSEPQKPNPYSRPTRLGSIDPSHDADGAGGNDNQGLNGAAALEMPRQPASPEPSDQRKIQLSTLSKGERDEIDKYTKRRRERPRAPRVKSASPAIMLASTLDEIRSRSAFGTCDGDFADLMLSGLVEASCDRDAQNPLSEKAVNRVLAAVNGVGAKDEVEGMLATQMVATHSAAMTALARLNNSETFLEHGNYGNLAIKFLRTYTAQMEALNRYRGKGQPTVTVEQVHVNSGGQAIVGAVTGGSSDKPEAQSAPPGITYEPGTAMRSQDPEREAVPVARSSREAALPNARRS